MRGLFPFGLFHLGHRVELERHELRDARHRVDQALLEHRAQQQQRLAPDGRVARLSHAHEQRSLVLLQRTTHLSERGSGGVSERGSE